MNASKIRKIMIASSMGTFIATATACAPATANRSLPPATSASGQVVTTTNEVCRVTPDAEAALVGSYTARVLRTPSNLNMTWRLSAVSIPGYSGRFLQSEMTVSNGSNGTPSTQTSTLCSETFRAGNTLTGVLMQSVPTTFSLPDLIAGGSRIRTGHRFESGRHQMEFFRCDSSFDQNCAQYSPISSVQVDQIQGPTR